MQSGTPKQILRTVGVFATALFVGLLVSFAGERALGAAQVLRGISLDERSLSGLSEGGVKAALSRRRARVRATAFELRLKDESLRASGAELGLTLDLEQGTAEVMGLGRGGNWLSQFAFWFRGLFSSREFQPQVQVDQETLQSRVGPWAEKLLPPPSEPTLAYDKKLLVEEGAGGSVVLYEELGEHLRKRQKEDAPAALQIPTKTEPPIVPAQLVHARRAQAEGLVSAPISIVAPDGAKVATLSVKTLGSALGAAVQGKDWVLSLSVESLRAAMKRELGELEKPAVSATFEFSTKGKATILPSETGLSLNEESLIQSVWQAAGAERQVTLVLQTAEPKLTTKQAEALGELSLVTSFVTRHPCCRPRVENIHTAAAAIDGVVLKPGEKFSLNGHLGPRTKASGYLSAPTIVRGKMKDMYGGGISQLATTLFNAVLRGGYEIIQRQPHSVYFPRYPEGHEATVSFPEPDLIFRNDTKSGMVIKTQATPTLIKVLIYGDAEGRVTSVKKSSRYKIEKPPQEFEADEDMKPEESKRLRAGQLGWTVLVSRLVRMPDGTKKEEQREVVYNARPELVRVHPCMIPKGKEGHTGEDCPEPEEEEIEEQEEVLSDDVYFETTETD